MLYVRGNLKKVTIDLAIHLYSALIFRLRCISIARKKSYIYVKNLTQDNCADFFLPFCKVYLVFSYVMVLISTDDGTSFLSLYLPLPPRYDH
jgi:hypothetical protein